MEASAPKPRIRIPDELRETILDFTIAYLLEHPSNFPAFGLQFFQRFKDRLDGKGPPFRPPVDSDFKYTENEDADNTPYALDETLTDWIIQFTIIYIIEKPTDIGAFGLMWFKRKTEAVEAQAQRGPEPEPET